MKAVRVNELCEPSGLKIEDVPRPEPMQGEVLIRVHCAALNFPDALMIKGQYQVKPPLPYTPGFELTGTVEAIGEGVTGLEPGQRVMAQTNLGAFAEYATAPAITVHPAPSGMSDEEACAFPLVYQTSYFGLAYRGQLHPGEHVLVHSAAGGVGLAAVQLARALGAAKIIGTVGSNHKKDVVLQNGADLAINYQTEDFVEEVKRITEGHGADVIYDPVGGEVAEKSTKCIAFEGRLVVIGFTSGAFPNFRANHILIKNYSVVGLHWGFYRQMNPAKIEQGWHDLIALVERDGIRPVVGATFPMTEASAAMQHMLDRQAVGKTVLKW